MSFVWHFLVFTVSLLPAGLESFRHSWVASYYHLKGRIILSASEYHSNIQQKLWKLPNKSRVEARLVLLSPGFQSRIFSTMDNFQENVVQRPIVFIVFHQFFTSFSIHSFNRSFTSTNSNYGAFPDVYHQLKKGFSIWSSQTVLNWFNKKKSTKNDPISLEYKSLSHFHKIGQLWI